MTAYEYPEPNDTNQGGGAVSSRERYISMPRGGLGVPKVDLMQSLSPRGTSHDQLDQERFSHTPIIPLLAHHILRMVPVTCPAPFTLIQRLEVPLCHRLFLPMLKSSHAPSHEPCPLLVVCWNLFVRILT